MNTNSARAKDGRPGTVGFFTEGRKGSEGGLQMTDGGGVTFYHEWTRMDTNSSTAAERQALKLGR